MNNFEKYINNLQRSIEIYFRNTKYLEEYIFVGLIVTNANHKPLIFLQNQFKKTSCYPFQNNQRF